MKKILILALALGAGVSTFAQTSNNDELKGKKGGIILPQTDDYSLGIGATTFLEYIGNVANGNVFNGAPTFDANSNWLNNRIGGTAIYGKKMIDAGKAYRVKAEFTVLNIVNTGISEKNVTTPLTNPPVGRVFVDDKQTSSVFGTTLSAGLEFRRGKSRVQGVYGAEALIGVRSVSRSFEYGNALSSTYTAATNTTNFGTNIVGAGRATSQSTGLQFGFGARAFAGVEFFVGPKVSIGGEFGYTLGFTTSGKGNTSFEELNGTGIIAYDVPAGPTNNTRFVGLSSDNLGGNIAMHFYF